MKLSLIKTSKPALMCLTFVFTFPIFAQQTPARINTSNNVLAPVRNSQQTKTAFPTTIISNPVRKDLVVKKIIESKKTLKTLQGGVGGGGGNPSTVEAGAIRMLITEGGLKKAMINYIRTLPLELIEDGQVRLSFQKMLNKNELENDIKKSNYVPSTADKPCTDAYNMISAASTAVGRPGSDICFDVDRLAKSYAGSTNEDVMVQLAGLAFHEHTHHFQDYSAKKIKENESEANLVGGYVLLTAHFMQIPVLKWSKPAVGSNDLQTIEDLKSLLIAKEQVFLSPLESDYKEYPDYRAKSDRGIIRLLPREKYNNKLVTTGDGAYYNFKKLTHDAGPGSDISLESSKLRVGFAGCDFGFFVDLGKTRIENIQSSLPELNFIFNFQPAYESETAVREQQKTYLYSNADSPVLVNGFKYMARIEFAVGNSYALRSINYASTDNIILLNILRKDTDGSLILIWKMLRTLPAKSCSKN